MTKWVTKTLIQLADYHNGMAFKPSDWTETGVKIIRIEQLNNPLGKYDYYQGSYPEINAIHNGDLIFSWSATLKVSIWKWGEGVLNQHLFKVVPFEDVDKNFLYFLLDYNMPKLGESSHGSTMRHIKRKELETYSVNIPESLTEQRRIASILSSADGAIAASEALIEKYRNIKRGLLATLLQPKEGWKTETLKDCTLKITDGCHNKPKCVERSSLIMLSSQNIQDNKLDLKDVSYLTEEDFERENIRTNVKAGDVLLTIVGTVGRTYLVKETDFRFTLQRSVAVLSPNTQLIESEFLLYYLNHSIPLLENEAHGCAQKGIYLKQLGDMPISYPKDKTEQKRIASILSSIDAKIAAEEKVVEKYKGVRKGLMEEMMKK